MPTIRSSEQLTNEGLYIFKGTATNINGLSIVNPIVQALDGTLHIARYRDTVHLVSYDVTTESFITLSFTVTAGLNASLAAQAPSLNWGRSVTIQIMPTKENTLGKIIPTEEVSGLNFLNSYEDELTDI